MVGAWVYCLAESRVESRVAQKAEERAGLWGDVSAAGMVAWKAV